MRVLIKADKYRWAGRRNWHTTIIINHVNIDEIWCQRKSMIRIGQAIMSNYRPETQLEGELGLGGSTLRL